MEKSVLRMAHLTILALLEATSALAASMPWLMNSKTTGSPSYTMSDSLVAWLLSCRQKATASLVSAFRGSPVSVLI